MSRRTVFTAALALATAGITVFVAQSVAEAANASDSRSSVERGRYLAKVAGCNDCHTPGYAMSGGKVPEKDWLVGDHLGWKGAWGTTYPANLRLSLARISEDDWVKLARTVEYRPPMPWFALRDMSEQDLRALHRFVRALGPAGEPAPAYVPPGQVPRGPVVTFPEPPAPAVRQSQR
jgi:mono/diheme cytochrome c family protein